MAHQIQIQELINGIQITETVDNEIVIKFLSYQGKPFFRTTNETDEETYQIIDKVGEIYNLPALATEFVLIDINDVVYIPANGAELIEYSVKLKPFRSETEEDESHTGLITTTANSLTINLSGDGVNWAKINGTFYERFYPDTFNFAPVTTGQKILIVYAIPDAMPFRLVQGVEGTEAVEPDYDGLFIARILVSSAGQVIEEAEPLRPKIQEESAWRNVIANNTAQWLQMTGTAGTSFNVQVAAGSSAPKIAGLRTKVNQNVYDGMELHFYNDSDTVVTFVAGDYAQTPNSTSIPFKENYIVQPRTTAEFKRKNNLFELMQSGASFPTGNTGDVLVKTDTGEEFSPRLTTAETAITTEKNRNDTQDGQIADLNIHQITINTTTSITTNTVGSVTGKGQHGRNVRIANGVNAINLTCELSSNADFVASYTKLGSATITFVAGSGTVLQLVDGLSTLSGGAGSTACLTREGNIYYLQISNR